MHILNFGLGIIPADFLQAFAEGGTGGGAGAGTAGAAGGSGTGANGSDAGSQAQGTQTGTDASAGAEDAEEAEYNKFRKRFKDRLERDTNEATKKAVQSRVRNLKPKADRMDAYNPILERLAQNAGIDVNDTAALQRYVDSDTSGIEKRAEERGVTIETEMEIERLERQARQSQEEVQRQKNAATYNEWKRQEADLRGVYPSFDLEAECHNERFYQLIGLGWTLKDAYEAIHGSELRSRAMQAGADAATRNVMTQVASNARRPAEGAARSGARQEGKFDVSSLTREQREKINRMVGSGAVITAEMLRTGRF